MRKTRINVTAALAALLLLSATMAACMAEDSPLDTGHVQKAAEVPCVKYADVNGDKEVNCSTWDKRCHIQTAIDAASAAYSEETGNCEVWVKEGTHKVWEDDYHDSVLMANHVSMYGGFKGDEEQTVEARNNRKGSKTILHGNKDGDDDCAPTTDCVKTIMIINDHDLIIDGFDIRYGYADGFGGTGFGTGGIGIAGNGYNILINDCDFYNNHSLEKGGALTIAVGAYAITVSNTVFKDNTSAHTSGAGAVKIEETGNQGTGASYCDPHNYWDKCINFDSVTFDGNEGIYGGAVKLMEAAAVFFNRNVFVDNVASGQWLSPSAIYPGLGGAIHITGSTTVDTDWRVENSLFQANTALEPISGLGEGGAIWVRSSGTGYIVNSTLVKNVSEDDKGCAVYALDDASYDPTIYIYNSILWNSVCASPLGGGVELYGKTTPDSYVLDDVLMLYPPSAYCVTCIDADTYPIDFVDAANDDFNLGNESSAIDAGDDSRAPTKDFDWYSRVDILGGADISDLGFLEATNFDPYGTACSSGATCYGNNCVDGYCCNNACSDTCRACNISGSEGTCTNHPDGTDPENDCGAVVCRACDGYGLCQGDFPRGTDPRNDCGDCKWCVTTNQCENADVYTEDPACGSYTCAFGGTCHTMCWNDNFCAGILECSFPPTFPGRCQMP